MTNNHSKESGEATGTDGGVESRYRESEPSLALPHWSDLFEVPWLAVLYIGLPLLILTSYTWITPNFGRGTTFEVTVNWLIALIPVVLLFATIQYMLAQKGHIRFVVALSPFYLSSLLALWPVTAQSPYTVIQGIFMDIPNPTRGELSYQHSILYIIVIFIAISTIVMVISYVTSRQGLRLEDRYNSPLTVILLDGVVLLIGGIAYYTWHGRVFWWSSQIGGGPTGFPPVFYRLLALHGVFVLSIVCISWLLRDRLGTIRKEIGVLCGVYSIPFLLTTSPFEGNTLLPRSPNLILSEILNFYLTSSELVFLVLPLLILFLVIRPKLPQFLSVALHLHTR